MAHKKLIPNPFIPPTHKIEDCECGGMIPGALGRTLIVCPACDGVISFTSVPCDCGDKFWEVDLTNLDDYTERYFVPWEGFVGLISKAWDELSSEERKIAVPVSQVYRNQRLS